MATFADYLTKHFTKGAIAWYAMMVRLPLLVNKIRVVEDQTLIASTIPSKSDMVAQLVELNAPVLRICQVQTYVNAWAERVPNFEGRAVLVEDAPTVQPIDRGFRAFTPPGPPPPSSAFTGSQLQIQQELIATVVRTVQEMKKVEKEESPQPEKTGALSPEDAYRKKLEDVITEGGYIDPHMLSRSVIRKKANRGLGHRNKEERAFQKIVGPRFSSLVRDDDEKADWTTHARNDAVGFTEGMFEIYAMWTRSTLMAPRIADHMDFFHQVIQYHLGTFEEKIRYCKEFMRKYSRESLWSPLFKMDMPLLTEHVHT